MNLMSAARLIFILQYSLKNVADDILRGKAATATRARRSAGYIGDIEGTTNHHVTSATRLTLILPAFSTEARCIECYQCRSDRDEGCYEAPVDDTYLQSCSQNATRGPAFCRKIHQILYFTKDNDEAYVRECGYLRHPDKEECFLARFPHAGYQLTCECTSEACNDAKARAAPTFATAATTAVAVAVAIRNHRLATTTLLCWLQP